MCLWQPLIFAFYVHWPREHLRARARQSEELGRGIQPYYSLGPALHILLALLDWTLMPQSRHPMPVAHVRWLAAALDVFLGVALAVL
jgi:hypothetical protein